MSLSPLCIVYVYNNIEGMLPSAVFEVTEKSNLHELIMRASRRTQPTAQELRVVFGACRLDLAALAYSSPAHSKDKSVP